MKFVSFYVARSRFFLLPVLLCLAHSSVYAGDDTCEPSGEYSFVCGPESAEDLVRIPETKWIVASGFGARGGIYLIDSVHKAWHKIYPGGAPRAEQDMKKFAACPGSPNPNSFVTHGLSVLPGDDGHSTLYAVGHGEREAIEVFDVDANADVPTITWSGCVMMPEGMVANSVASLADGSLLATVPLLADVPINDALAGKNTGGVFSWAPGDSGWTMVDGTDLPYANGIEVSADGDEFYVASSGLLTVIAYSNSNPARRLRSSEPVGFVPDNLHMGPDGNLLTAGLNLYDEVCGHVPQSEEFDLGAFASCPRPFTVLSVDPQSMQGTVIATGPANERFSNITMALPLGKELWIGTFGGDRIAYRSLR